MAAAMRLVPAIILTLALAAALYGRSLAAAETPAGTIERLHGTLLEVMRAAKGETVEQRYRHLQPILDDVYDFRTMTKLVTGSAWTGASEAQRAALVTAFSRLSMATYADRFSGYSGERFEILGQRDGPRGTTLVDTRIVRPTDPPVPITYVLHQQDGSWQIIDVIVERSISELAVRRSEYAQGLRQGGVDHLTEILNAKADALLAG